MTITTQKSEPNLKRPNYALSASPTPSSLSPPPGGNWNWDDDPYGIANGVMADEDIAQIRNRKERGGEKIAQYYENQNEYIRSALKPMAQHTTEDQDAKEQARLPVRIAVWGSLMANICLSVLQLYAAISSLSLSFFATALDSIFDLLSNITLNYLHKKARKVNPLKWPVGRYRLETIGNVVYGSLMGGVNLVIIVESIRTIVEHNASADSSDTNEFHIPSVVAVGTALGTKILLFLYCYTLRKTSSQVQILWEDHRNDIAICTFGLLTSTGGSRLVWFLDPLGAIAIGAGIAGLWVYRVYREFELLAGKSADHDFIQLITYKASTFHPSINGVDTVRVYHSGTNYFVELDVVLPPTLPLRIAHDIGQKLQDAIEIMPGVERAFVHLDWEGQHVIEHQRSMMLENAKEKAAVMSAGSSTLGRATPTTENGTTV